MSYAYSTEPRRVLVLFSSNAAMCASSSCVISSVCNVETRQRKMCQRETDASVCMMRHQAFA